MYWEAKLNSTKLDNSAPRYVARGVVHYMTALFTTVYQMTKSGPTVRLHWRKKREKRAANAWLVVPFLFLFAFEPHRQCRYLPSSV